MFDQLTIERLDYYVYALINPIDGKPFYIGEGLGNRVFSHINCVLRDKNLNLKLDTIRQIISQNRQVKHIILRHGLTKQEAIEVEATLIDFGNYLNFNLTNIAKGHHSNYKGLMTTDEVIGLYNAKPLEALYHPVIIININKGYRRGGTTESIYNSTKYAWIVGKQKRETVQYAIAEYGGIILEVFKIDEWYSAKLKDNKKNNRWGFHGEVAEESVRSLYVNKSIAHTKKKARNPIRYVL